MIYTKLDIKDGVPVATRTDVSKFDTKFFPKDVEGMYFNSEIDKETQECTLLHACFHKSLKPAIDAKLSKPGRITGFVNKKQGVFTRKALVPKVTKEFGNFMVCFYAEEQVYNDPVCE